MQVSYLPEIQQIWDEINTLNERLSRMTSAVEIPESRHLLVKIFSVGDQRKLEEFLSDPTVFLHEVKVTGKFGSSKDFEVCLIYTIDSAKTTHNKFRRVIATPISTREEIIASVLNRVSVKRLFLTSFVTEQGFWYVLFWEEAEANTSGDSDDESA